jgi:hypothetical protein
MGAIKQIQSLGIPCVNFFCDNVREFKTIPIEFSAFDLNWVPEFMAIELYKKAGYKYINLPMPMWIEPGLRVLHNERNSQVTFIGSKDAQRQLFFEELIQKDPSLPLAIYGNGWDENGVQQTPQVASDYSFNKKLLYQYQFIKENGIAAYLRKLDQRKNCTEISPALKSKVQGTISFDVYNKLTAESMITMGINRYPSYSYPIDKPNTYSRLRDLEAPMLGACYLTEHTYGIDNLYDIGNEIEVFYNADSLVEKIKVLQGDSKKREQIKINGQKRALNDHTVGQSLNKIFEKLN